MAIDVEIADAPALVKIGESARAGDRHRMVAAAQDDLGPAVQTLRQIMIDILMRLLVVARHDGDVAAIDDPEEGQEIDVVFEHVGEILRRGLANACRPLRGSGAHHLALIPGHADEAHLGAHGADGVAVGRAIGRAQEGGDALRLEGAVVQLRRIDVIVGALVLMGSLMLMRHVLPGHGLAPGVASLRAVACQRGRRTGSGRHEPDRNELHLTPRQHLWRGPPAIGAAEIVERRRRLHRVAIGAQHRERHLVDVQPRSFAQRFARRGGEAEMQRPGDAAQHTHSQVDLGHARRTEVCRLIADLFDQRACDRHLMHCREPLLPLRDLRARTG